MSQLYQVRHVTRYRYEKAVSECVMEVRKCPLSEGSQRCLNFSLRVDPEATVFHYQESCGNVVYHFNHPQPHRELSITAEALVELKDPPPLPACLQDSAWEELAQLGDDASFCDYVLPSPLVKPTEALRELYRELKGSNSEDPLTLVRRLNHEIYSRFDYVPLSTQVDSPIDTALNSKQGVCQDFAHILVALCRQAGIPSRYVSGYLFHRKDGKDRSLEDASHAWVEVYLPALGWLGLDPTNDILARERHIRTCLGRDYKDVPPTRGVYRGESASELSVAVQVHPADLPNEEDEFRRMDESDLDPGLWAAEAAAAAAAQQQQ